MSCFNNRIKKSTMVLLSGLLLCLTASMVEARTLSYSTSSPPADTGVNRALQWWADEIEKRTNGELKINVHYMNSLVKLKDAVDGISAGVADAGYVVPAYSQAKLPLHYISTTGIGPGDQYAAMIAWQRMYEKFPQLKEEMDRSNLVHIGHFSIGPGVLLSKGHPYMTPADFNGDKVRLASRWVKAALLEKWNVTPVNLTFPDIYTALERGTIDGAQSYLNNVLSYRHNEVIDHVVLPNIGQQMNIIVMNKRVYDSLSDEQRSVIADLQDEYLERLAKGDIDDNLSARNDLKNDPKYPVEVHDVTGEQRQVWEKAVSGAENENVERTSKRNPAVKALYDTYLKEIRKVDLDIQENGYPWDKD
ncbi:C4-dicarboxylate TRAP transporter substrate-binding protein [Alloalcanivorax xenomutans]|uniref:C4-dicarboxylate TRAP transporter substrate-binding protein n=1 Tax=Alloalcanivorax xenomutans TaxID=1094342 RepID=UPI0009B5DCA4|nr:C4-dicarboxylate TRAP transporter substrate-binding protein [Alloalcanivorax xenomutans]ARB45969.1 hypothetical protein P40_11580 [Alloalcanivorax xenomutans]MCE7522048.1 C4-dicarboxylate TRAP transporter substrate-binding protein [Alloalcanivorax xenomutans]